MTRSLKLIPNEKKFNSISNDKYILSSSNHAKTAKENILQISDLNGVMFGSFVTLSFEKVWFHMFLLLRFQSCEMTLLICTIILTSFVSQTLPKDSSVISDRQRVTSAGEAGVSWVLQGSEVTLRCQVNTSGCGQYHNVKGRFKNWQYKFFY